MTRSDQLRIGKLEGRAFVLPLDAVTQKNAFLGRTGSGKSYAAMKMAEQILDVGAQIVVLDPVGIWWGLRLGKDGRSPGYKIPLFGGLRGDIPLQHTAGAHVADLIVDRGLSVILDVSQFEHDTEKAAFANAFARRFFFRKKAAPSPVHLFLEECQEFIPQNPAKGEEHMLNAFNRMWKLGRNFGIGGSLISQRPQEVNKKALNMTGALFAFQMAAPHERKVVRDWASYQGGTPDIDELLPMLPVGNAHLDSPQWLGVSGRVAIAAKKTFDSSSTPKAGAVKVQVRELAPGDLEKIRVDLAATIEEAEANDPKALKRRVVELERELAKRKGAKESHKNAITIPDPTAVQKAVHRALAAERRELRKAVAAHDAKLARWLRPVHEAAGKLFAAVEAFPPALELPDPGGNDPAVSGEIRTPPVTSGETRKQPTRAAAPTPQPPVGDLSLKGPHLKILGALAQLEAIGVDKPDRVLVGAMANYAAGGGSFKTYLSALSTAGLVAYASADTVHLTDAGRDAAGYVEPPRTLDELHARVLTLNALAGPHRKILAELLEAWPDPISREKLGERTNYVASGGSFKTYLSKLSSAGFVEYPDSETARASDLLFPAALR